MILKAEVPPKLTSALCQQRRGDRKEKPSVENKQSSTEQRVQTDIAEPLSTTGSFHGCVRMSAGNYTAIGFTRDDEDVVAIDGRRMVTKPVNSQLDF